MRLLARLLPAASRFNSFDDPDVSGVPADLRPTIDANCFAGLVSIKQLCFLVAQPLTDLKGQPSACRAESDSQTDDSLIIAVCAPFACCSETVYAYLSSCFTESMVELGEGQAHADRDGPQQSSPKPLQLDWNDARRITLAVQSALHVAMSLPSGEADPDKDKMRMAEEAVDAWRLMLQHSSREWKTKLVSCGKLADALFESCQRGTETI